MVEIGLIEVVVIGEKVLEALDENVTVMVAVTRTTFFDDCRKAKEKKAFAGGAWSDSDNDDQIKEDATCLMTIGSKKCLSFELPEDVVNKTLQIILDLCSHHSSKLFSNPSYQQSNHIVSDYSHHFQSSLSFGHQKGACPWSTENHFNSQYMKHWAIQSFGT
ncbi:hypothetical protein Tco_0090734 [Tanacetum coccineum]